MISMSTTNFTKIPQGAFWKTRLSVPDKKQVAKYGNRPLTAGENLDCSLLMTHIKAFKNHLLISATDTKGEIFVESERKNFDIASIYLLPRLLVSWCSLLYMYYFLFICRDGITIEWISNYPSEQQPRLAAKIRMCLRVSIRWWRQFALKSPINSSLPFRAMKGCPKGIIRIFK